MLTVGRSSMQKHSQFFVLITLQKWIYNARQKNASMGICVGQKIKTERDHSWRCVPLSLPMGFEQIRILPSEVRIAFEYRIALEYLYLFQYFISKVIIRTLTWPFTFQLCSMSLKATLHFRCRYWKEIVIRLACMQKC